MKKILLVAILISAFANAKAQVAIGYFPFNYSTVQLTSNPQHLVFGDFRVETNSLISNLNLALAINVNLIRRDKYNFYVGPGITSRPVYNGDESSIIQGYYFTAGVRWMPFEKLKALGVILEISPYVDHTFESGKLQSFLGVSYDFGRKQN